MNVPFRGVEGKARWLVENHRAFLFRIRFLSYLRLQRGFGYGPHAGMSIVSESPSTVTVTRAG
jgi:hypothetical protein